MSTSVVKEELDLPSDFKGRLAFLLHNVFTKEECDEYIKKTEEIGYEDFEVNVSGGRQRLMTDVRSKARCIWDSEEEARRIFERIKQFIPAEWNGREVLGINERLRILRYNPVEHFQPHKDMGHIRDNEERSFFSIELYLNEGCTGGNTTFMSYSGEGNVEVIPETGMVLVFEQNIMHKGSTLKEGTKYTLRTDVMYSTGKDGV